MGSEAQQTWIDVIRQHFPGADEKFADYVLWEKTAFPVAGDGTIRQQIADFALVCKLRHEQLGKLMRDQ